MWSAAHSRHQADLSLSSLCSYLKKPHPFISSGVLGTCSIPFHLQLNYEKVWWCEILDSGCVWKYTSIFWAVRITNVAPTFYSLYHHRIFLKTCLGEWDLPRGLCSPSCLEEVQEGPLVVSDTQALVHCQLQESLCDPSLPIVWGSLPIFWSGCPSFPPSKNCPEHYRKPSGLIPFSAD